MTHQLLADDAVIERFHQINNPISHFVVELLKFFKSTYKSQFDMDGGPIHDACTILYLLHPEIFTLQKHLFKSNIKVNSHMAQCLLICIILINKNLIPISLQK